MFQGHLTELTRCVVKERALCEQRHAHLSEWLNRGGLGRRSERQIRTFWDPDGEAAKFPRSRSFELLDGPLEDGDVNEVITDNVVRRQGSYDVLVFERPQKMQQVPY